MSLDGGATPIVYFNQVQGDDFHDWASVGEVYDKAPEVQDVFGNPAASSTDFSQQPTNGSAEIDALHAVGYNFNTSAVPDPSAIASLVGMLVPGALLMRRRLRK